MRLRTHILTSALLAAAMYPRAPRKAALVLAGGVLLDTDHYLLYALRSGNWNPLSALRYDRWRNQPITADDRRRRYGSLRSIFHSARVTLPLAWLLGWRWPYLRPLAIGVTLHLALDTSPLRLDWRVWRRAGGRCERCGRLGLRRGVYYVNHSRAGGSRWALDNRAAWCYDCLLADRSEKALTTTRSLNMGPAREGRRAACPPRIISSRGVCRLRRQTPREKEDTGEALPPQLP